MRAQLLTISLIVGTTASTAAGQRSVVYEFSMTLVENNITGSSHVGLLNGMPLGTPAVLSIEAADNLVATDGVTYANYQILNAGFEAPGLSAPGNPSTYPTTGLNGSLGIGDEAYSGSAGGDIDYFVAGLFLDNPEIAGFSTFVLTDADEINGDRLLIDSLALPEQMDINLVDAERRLFQLSSSQNNERAFFEITLIEATVVPAPPAAAVLGLGLAAVARRRR